MLSLSKQRIKKYLLDYFEDAGDNVSVVIDNYLNKHYTHQDDIQSMHIQEEVLIDYFMDKMTRYYSIVYKIRK